MSPTPTNPADLLRKAADRLREAAGHATPGPWRTHDTHLDLGGHTATVLSGERNETQLLAWLPTMSHESWDETRNAWRNAGWMALMDPSVGLAVAAWLEAEAAAPITAQHSTRCVDPQCTTLAALTVARRVLGTTGQPATAPWPPTGVERPDHGLYTLLRRVGLTPEAAQQEIDTYTQTILARQGAPAVAPATVCICGHTEAQHFEDVCQVCDCGDYLEPEAAREMIAHLRAAVLAKQDGRRATTLREGADLIEQTLIHSVAPVSSERDEVWDQAVRAAATELRDVADGVAAEAQQPTPAEAALCDLMFEDGRQCAKPDGHRPFGSDDPHVPAPAEETK